MGHVFAAPGFEFVFSAEDKFIENLISLLGSLRTEQWLSLRAASKPVVRHLGIMPLPSRSGMLGGHYDRRQEASRFMWYARRTWRNFMDREPVNYNGQHGYFVCNCPYCARGAYVCQKMGVFYFVLQSKEMAQRILNEEAAYSREREIEEENWGDDWGR